MERDDLIEYSLYNHHGEEEGKKIRKKIVKVTIIMTVITIVELTIGIFFGKKFVGGVDTNAWQAIKIFYLVLTVVKAGYIVLSFMHLGDEKRDFKWIILAPYILFILYLVFICLTEAAYVSSVWQSVK